MYKVVFHMPFLVAVKCTNMGRAQQVKAGILLWMRRPITSKSCSLSLFSTHTHSCTHLHSEISQNDFYRLNKSKISKSVSSVEVILIVSF